MMSTRRPQYASYNNAGYGPTFGGGHDLHIANNCRRSRSSYTNLGYSYATPSNYRYSSSSAKNMLAGSYNFYCHEYEVFYLTGKSKPTRGGSLSGSSIMSSQPSYKKSRLNNFISGVSNGKSWRLCFKASQHNYNSRSFHRACDGKGPTLTLVKVGSRVFGGYNSLSWNCKLSLYTML